MRSLKGKVCLLTGATGGIGQSLSKALQAAGAQLALSDRDASSLEALATALSEDGPRPSTHTADMRDAGSIRAMASAVEATHGRLDMLICNAGVMTFGPFADHAHSDIDWITEVNLSGLLHTCHACIPVMRRSGGGQIVLMCSMNALFAVPTSLMYATTKWGVRGFGMGLRAELAADKIGVTTVMPGAVATTLIAQARSYDDELVSQLAPLIERFATRPDHLARKVLRAARKNRAELVVGLDAWSIWLITRCTPGLLSWLLTWSYRRTARRINTSQ